MTTMKHHIKRIMSSHPFGMFKTAQPPAQSVTEKLAERLAEIGKKRKILFVDDDDALQELMQTIQKSCSVDVIPAQTAGVAKALIKERPFDLVILDVGILNGNGVELYKWILQTCPTLNVIFLTGRPADEVKAEVHKIGGSAVVYEKPTADTMLFIKNLLTFATRRTAYTPNV